MPSAPKPPPQPTAGDLIGQQNTANQQVASTQQRANQTDQTTPYGTLNYSETIDPATGQPRYSATSQLSPIQQGLLGETQATGLIQGGTGTALAANEAPFYASAPNFTQGATSLTAQAEAPVQAAYQRFLGPQMTQRDNELRNQGIMPGTPAYQQQMDALTQQQNLTEGSWLANFQPTAFGESVTSYNTPEQMIAQLFGIGQPAQLPGQFVNTPQVSLNAANANQANAVSLGQGNFDYGEKVKRQNNQMTGIMNSIPAMTSMGSGAMSMIPMLFA